MDLLRAYAVFARTPGLTAQRLCSAAAQLGSLASPGELARQSALRDLPPRSHACLTRPDAALIEADLRWTAASGARLIPCTAPEYPPLLAQIADAPAVLYVLGDAGALTLPQLAMVGSRSPTATGRATAQQFASFLARCGLTITSGLAQGIDTASHAGALAAGGRTVAVCGTGLDRPYPAENAALAERIRASGALVSEFPPGTPPRRAHFPRRNRIISALALGTLVVEAARESGALITARCAADQGREVFAIPGSIHSPLSRGCHRLIRDGAKLVESAQDILDELNFHLGNPQVTAAPTARGAAPALDKEYEMLLDALGFEPASIDELAARSGLPGGSVASMLLILELEGRIAPHPGGRYCRLP